MKNELKKLKNMINALTPIDEDVNMHYIKDYVNVVLDHVEHIQEYLDTLINQEGTEDRVLHLMDEILKSTSIVQLSTQQGIAVFKRFVYGDLKHVGEAMLEGKDIYYYDKKLTSNYRAYFDGDAKNFNIRERTRTVFGVEVSIHDTNKEEFWRVYTLDGSFVFKYVTVDKPTNLDFNTEEEARLVTNALNEMSRGN